MENGHLVADNQIDTLLHESGHAVVALALKAQVNSVSISVGGSSGETLFDFRDPPWLTEFYEIDLRTEPDHETRFGQLAGIKAEYDIECSWAKTCVYVAGVLASFDFGYRFDDIERIAVQPDTDMEKLKIEAAKLIEIGEVGSAVDAYRIAVPIVKGIVAANRYAIAKLAVDLEAKRELRGTQVIALVGNSVRDFRGPLPHKPAFWLNSPNLDAEGATKSRVHCPAG